MAAAMTTEQRAAYDAWTAEQRSDYDGWPADVGAYYWNPAALSGIKRYEVVADYAKPYGIPDLNVGTLAVAGRHFGTGWAVAWPACPSHRQTVS